tara:strand:+ start:446 stop:625 length:180 start_codon:yes stop_codon:yes gene_type:complete
VGAGSFLRRIPFSGNLSAFVRAGGKATAVVWAVELVDGVTSHLSAKPIIKSNESFTPLS